MDVGFFGTAKPEGNGIGGEGNPSEVAARLDAALTAVFSDNGKRTVLYYMSNKFGLSLEQATRDPSKLEKALTSLLGEIGWMVVKREILEQFWDRKIAVEEVSVVKGASLREAFGLIRSLNLKGSLGPY